MTNKCRTKMVQKEIYNVREHPQGRRPPLALCSIKPDRNPLLRTVGLSPRIMSPSSSMFLVPIQSSLTPTLTVVKLIEA